MRHFTKHTLSATLALALAAALPIWAHAGPAKSKGARKVAPAKVAKTVSKGKKDSAKPDTGAPKKAKSYNFEGDDIDGDRLRDDGTTIFGLPSAKHTSLIRLREHFLPEITKSADRL